MTADKEQDEILKIQRRIESIYEIIESTEAGEAFDNLSLLGTFVSFANQVAGTILTIPHMIRKSILFMKPYIPQITDALYSPAEDLVIRTSNVFDLVASSMERTREKQKYNYYGNDKGKYLPEQFAAIQSRKDVYDLYLKEKISSNPDFVNTDYYQSIKKLSNAFGQKLQQLKEDGGDYRLTFRRMNQAHNEGRDIVTRENLDYWISEYYQTQIALEQEDINDYQFKQFTMYSDFIQDQMFAFSDQLGIDLAQAKQNFRAALSAQEMPYAGEAVYANGQMAWGADATALLKDSTTAIKENAEATKNLVEEKQNLASSQEVINSLLADSATAADKSTEAIITMTAAQYWQQQNAALAEYVDELLHHNEVIKVTQADWNALKVKVKVEDFESPDLIDDEDWAEAIQEEYNAHYIPFPIYINNDMDVAPYNNSNKSHYLSNETLDRCKAAA